MRSFDRYLESLPRGKANWPPTGLYDSETGISVGIPKSTFYLWYDRYSQGGVEALEDRKPAPRAVWNKIPKQIGQAILDLALPKPCWPPDEITKPHSGGDQP